MKKLQGFSLIELIIFIVVMGIAAVGILISLHLALENSPNIEFNIKALHLAQARIELILEQKKELGFVSFSDPCTLAVPPAVCTAPTGYNVASSIISSGTNFKIITVNVTGQGHSQLTTLVANY